MTVEFKQRIQVATDGLGNAQYSYIGLSVDDCLIAPMLEPRPVRENQGKDQTRDQIRIHLPKTFTGDVAGSYIAYDGRIFYIDSGGVTFMAANTPTRWNRYLLGESVGAYDADEPDIWLHFFVTEDSQYVLTREGS